MSIRKVAMVVTGLDRDTADRLLDQLPSPVAQQVRDAVLSLGEIDANEQRQAIEQFLQGVGGPSNIGPHLAEPTGKATPNPAAGGLSVDLSLGATPRGPAASDPPRRRSEATSPVVGERPIDIASERLIAECLRNEMPQAIAVALAQLPTRRASEVVSHLPAELQAAVLERMVALDPSSSRDLVNVHDDFQAWLHEQIERALHRSELAARLATILGATNSGTRERILHNVSNSDAGLAKELHHQLTATVPTV